jgi:hypothetical protein
LQVATIITAAAAIPTHALHHATQHCIYISTHYPSSGRTTSHNITSKNSVQDGKVPQVVESILDLDLDLDLDDSGSTFPYDIE